MNVVNGFRSIFMNFDKFKTAYAISIVLFVISLASYFINFRNHPISDSPGDWGVFGDYVGGTVSAIFGFASFVALLYTILIQIKNNKAVVDNFSLERFESNFHSLLTHHLNMVQSLSISVPYNGGVNSQSGRKVFRLAFEELDRIASEFKTEHNGQVQFSSIWETFYNLYQPAIGHYFRSLYHVFHFIASEFPKTRKFEQNKSDIFQYSKIARSQMQAEELALLYFNGKSPRGINFKKYIEYFSLLEDMPTEFPSAKEFIPSPDLYAESAFHDSSPKTDIFGGKAEKDKSKDAPQNE